MFGFFNPKPSSPNPEDKPYANERDAFISKVMLADKKEWNNTILNIARGKIRKDQYNNTARFLCHNAGVKHPQSFQIQWIITRISQDGMTLSEKI